jgi:hypothetical protein
MSSHGPGSPPPTHAENRPLARGNVVVDGGGLVVVDGGGLVVVGISDVVVLVDEVQPVMMMARANVAKA